MKKMCIYVEGQTELYFVEKIVTEIANKNSVSIQLMNLKGGGKRSNIPETITILKSDIKSSTEYYVQIVNCQNDNRVQSKINETYKAMENKGFLKVLGLRDLYPFGLDKLNIIKQLSLINDPNLAITVKTIIAVFEIETWFLSEYNFFAKIDPRLTLSFIKGLGFDLENDLLDSDLKYHHSADVLHKIYQSVRRSYDKKADKSMKIIESIDYNILYCISRYKLKALDEFISEIDDFFK